MEEQHSHHQQQQQQNQEDEVDVAYGQQYRTEWILTAPNPPSLLDDLLTSVKEAVFSQGNASRTSHSKKTRALSFLKGLFPILSWAREYRPSKFKHDLMAGLTLASLCIPQSIGYAGLAKLDPQYGLYTSAVPPLIYSVMGSSREIAIGPVAVVSLLLSSMVQKVEDPMADPIAYRNFVFTVTFFAGTFQAMFGFFRLGFLVDFLSHAAIVGFMAGAAIVIGLQQLKGLLGITHFTTKTDVVSVLKSVITSISHPWSPFDFLIGCSFLIFLLFARYVGRKNKKLFWFPAIAPLLSVILSTLLVFLTKADKHGVKILRHIKGGFNESSIHDLQLGGPHVGEAAKIGLIAAVVALTEAIAVGRSFASIKGYHLDGNKEMLAMGFMNIAGSLSSCYVATGSFSRTAVNFTAGCETAVSNIVMAVTVILSLEVLTRLLYYTPNAILASIILSALPGLIDVHEARYIWTVDKMDFFTCIAAFFGVLFATVEIGLLLAVTISIAKILLNSIRPGIETLGRLPQTDSFYDLKQYPMAAKHAGILTVGINSSLMCFANSNFIRQRIMRLVNEDSKETVQFVILDMSNVCNVDTAGILALEEILKDLQSQATQLAIASPKWQVVQKLKIAKFIDRIGSKWVFLTVMEAVDASIAASGLRVTDAC